MTKYFRSKLPSKLIIAIIIDNLHQSQYLTKANETVQIFINKFMSTILTDLHDHKRIANPIQSVELSDYRLSNFVSIGLPKVFIDRIIIDGFFCTLFFLS